MVVLPASTQVHDGETTYHNGTLLAHQVPYLRPSATTFLLMKYLYYLLIDSAAIRPDVPRLRLRRSVVLGPSADHEQRTAVSEVGPRQTII